MSVINILNRKGPKTDSCGTRKKLKKVRKRCLKCVQIVAEWKGN